MKKLLFLAACLPMLAGAEEVKDTTFVVNGKSIVVDVDGDKTNVKVYGKDGNRETKISEMNYIDGQEVERVFVGSPFVPTENLQHLDFSPRFATVWMGMSSISSKVMGSSELDHARYSKSFELGVTPYYMSVPFNKSHSLGLSMAAQVVWSHLCFQKDCAVGEEGGRWHFKELGYRADGNNINFLSLRVPFMFTWQSDYDFELGIGLTPEFRTNAWYRRKGPEGKFTDTYKLNHAGLGLALSWGFGPVVMGGNFGLTPLFKTADGKKAYQTSAYIGFDALAFMKILNYSKDRKKNNKAKALLDN